MATVPMRDPILRIAFLGLCATTALPPVAHASEPPPTADEDLDPRGLEYYERGRAAYDTGDYATALEQFSLAYELLGDPILLYNIASCHDRRDEFDAAIEYYERYRAEADASEHEEIDQVIADLRQRKALAQPEQPPDPEPDPPPDPEPASPSPSPSPSEVEPPPTSSEQPEPDERPEPPGPIPTEQSPDVSTTDLWRPSAEPPPKILDVWAGVLIGSGSAAVILGTILSSVALTQRRRARNECGEAQGAIHCTETGSEHLEVARRLALGADISFAISGVVAAGLITVVARRVHRRRKAQRATARPTIQPTIHWEGLGIAGRF